MSAAVQRTSKKRQRSEPSALAKTAVPEDNINEGFDDGEDRDDEEDGHDFEDEDVDNIGDDDQDEEDDVAESSQTALKKAKTSGTSSAERRGKDKDKSQSKSKSKSKRKAPTPGIVYISRLPPGMTPQKVRHLMARWGEVGKVYAQRRDAPSGYNPNSAAAKKQKQKHRQADFTEAWVEFLDKAMAKTVAQMLNAQVIGGKKGDRWRDDIWTMRYLSGFKWEMLGEQVAYEKQAHQARLRNEITQSKSAQDQYLRNVELARVLAKRQQKKVDAGGDAAAAAAAAGSASAGGQAKAGKSAAGKGQDEEGKKSGYRQREAVDRSKAGQGAGMDAVLSSIF